jgi:hypothetical protein
MFGGGISRWGNVLAASLNSKASQYFAFLVSAKSADRYFFSHWPMTASESVGECNPASIFSKRINAGE